jgi:hypothetical protein
MKKIIAYIFILIANFVLLYHAVIPHHHHDKQVCIERAHCKSDSEAHQHEATEQNHNHQHDGNSSSCILNQVFVSPASQSKQIHECSDCNDNHSHDFQFILFNVSPETVIPSCKSVISAIEVTPLYSSLLQSSLDLRGPPTV